MSAISYRPDIDGLRAVAVLSVILFHAGLPLVGGGFVGVDVFFVISGFLITSLILKDLEAGQFSLLHFWERRIRRILPALAVVVFATLALGAFLYLPRDFAEMGVQAAWQSVTASNFYFMDKTDYFDTQHELKPLLHTWSLAVEEQFYLLMPVALLFIWRVARSKTALFLWLGTALSFALGLWAVMEKPEAAFYLLPFRAWELSVGALLAFYLPALKPCSRKTHEIAGIVSLAAIAASALLFTSKLSFPGAWALIPCLGAVVLIWSGANRNTLVYKALSHKAPVFIGKISYSWYLWHWPIFCIAEYILQREYSKTEKIICILLSFALACLTWKLVETPFRKAGGVFKTRRAVFITALLTIAAMGGTGLAIKMLDGMQQRFSEEAMTYAKGAEDRSPIAPQCRENSYERLLKDDVCESNAGSGIAPSFMLWGDSYADAMTPAFLTLSKKYGKNGYIAFKHGCPPIFDIHMTKNDVKKPYCRQYNDAHFAFIKKHKIKHVYLVANWSSWVTNKQLYFADRDWYAPYAERYDNIVLAGVQRTVDELQKIGVKTYFLLNTPSMPIDPPRALAIETMLGVKDSKVYTDKSRYLSSRAVDMDHFVDENKNSRLVIADPISMMCPEEKCIAARDGRSLYFDTGHISTHGANYLAPVIEPFFKELD